jgi:hypothetical protein
LEAKAVARPAAGWPSSARSALERGSTAARLLSPKPWQAGPHFAEEGLILRGQTSNARIRGTRHDRRRLDDLRSRELTAGQVDLDAIGESVPVVHALTGSIGVVDLGEQELASEEVLHHKRCHGALPAGRILG